MFTLSNFLTFSLSVCALLVTFIFVNREADLIKADERIRVANWHTLPVGTQSLGAPEAATRVIVLFDYDCPYCARLDKALLTLFDEAEGQFSLSFVNVPLDIHPGAFSKATASLCASEQGQFRAYHEMLFSGVAAEDLDFEEMAREAGVPDEAAFSACLHDELTAARINKDLELANSLALDGVPALIVDGALYVGAYEEEQLREMLGL